MIMEKALRILEEGYVCDHCLGRQFSDLLTGYTNKERGKALRMVLGMEYEAGAKLKINASNIMNIGLRKKKEVSREKCTICNDIFEDLGKIAERAVRKLEGIEFSTFMVGTLKDDKLWEKEDALKERGKSKDAESIRHEINRELGKLIAEKTGKSFDKNPDVLILFHPESRWVRVEITSLFIYGKYQKLVRGIPQTKWGDHYPYTVEDIMAKIIMKLTNGSEHALHGEGREDIDARCLAWRPFVFEVKNPDRRIIDLKKIQEKINKSRKIQVSDLRFSNKREVVKIKEARHDKTYRALVELEKPFKEEELKKLKDIITTISQKTPQRVLHRRSDLLRKRRVISIKWKKVNNKKIEIEIKGEAGLYIKELVSGDGGRTTPSVSGILKNQAVVKELDVIKIEG